MSRTATTDEVKELVDAGAQLVDVLPNETFLQEHLPGAVNIPLAEIHRAADELDRTQPVVTYCYDHQCDLSSRAAAWLDALGFTDVVDYVDSKVAWLGDGLPGAGLLHDDRRAGSRVHEDVPRVKRTATTAEVGRVAGDWEVVVVVDDDDVVLGVVRPEAGTGPDVAVVDVLQSGPPTVRPSMPVREMAESMDDDGQRHLIVSTNTGRLLGLVRRDDLRGG